MSVLTADSLIAALPDGIVVTDPATIENYRYDWSRDPGAGTPLAVVRPTGADQVQAVVRWCAENRIPIVPRGAGTSLSGGSSAVDGGIVCSMERMRAIEIDTTTRVAVVEPGAFNAEVKAAAAQHGLWYPPDPSSYEICSIGGNIATNAGGLCCVKYGVTTDYVLGLDVVLADGEKIVLGGKRIKDVAGLSLLKLFVGSEGTLGIITRAILRLVPAQPPRATLVATFADPEAAARAVVALGMVARPSMVELMDNASINIVEDFQTMGLDRNAGALLLVQSDAPGAACSAEIALAEQAVAAEGAVECFATDDPEEGEMFAEARRIFFPAVEGRGALMLEDVGVPVPELPMLFAGIAAIAANHQVDIPVVAHAGDGNTHPTIVFDPSDTAARDRAAIAFTEIMELALSLGGTITGEHGIGRLKKELLPTQLGPRVTQLTREVKQLFDPDNILNPGAIL
jgi:glycolate oxidase